MTIMKVVLGSLVLSLGMIAYAERPVETGIQSCSSYVWECQYSCPFDGGQNVLVSTCDGTIVAELPCSPDGCF